MTGTVSTPVRERALAYVIRELSGQPGSGWLGQRADRQQLDVTLELFVLLGALSGREAEDWRRRIEEAAHAPEPEAGLRERAGEHLRHLDASDGGHEVYAIEGAVAAFAGLGLLTEAEERQWHDRLQAREPEPRPGSEAARWIERLERMQAFDDTTLVRSLVGPPDRAAGLRVTLIELATGGVVVHWHFTADQETSPETAALWRRLSAGFDDFDEDELDAEDMGLPGESELMALADDVGTEYLCASSGYSASGDDRRAAYGETGFVPAVPAEATRLEMIVEGQRRSVNLTTTPDPS